jgi:hypothetical protein
LYDFVTRFRANGVSDAATLRAIAELTAVSGAKVLRHEFLVLTVQLVQLSMAACP